MGKFVSIIMPVYNTEDILLEKAVESILNQNYSSFELLLVDDGSKNEAAAKCDFLARLDSRIHVFHIPNGGVSKARNYALDRAKGEYIVFVDSDDFVTPLFLENLMTAVQKGRGVEIVKGGAVRVYDTSASLESTRVFNSRLVSQSEAIDDISFIKHPFPNIEITAVWGTLYSRSIIGDTRFREDVSIGEDYIFNIEIIRKLESIVYLSTKDYGYYINPRSAMVGGYSKRKVDSVRGFESYIASLSGDAIYRKEIINRLVNISIVILLMVPITKEHKNERKDVITFIKKYRGSIVRDRKTRRKVRGALLISYVSFSLMQRLYLKFSDGGKA